MTTDILVDPISETEFLPGLRGPAGDHEPRHQVPPTLPTDVAVEPPAGPVEDLPHDLTGIVLVARLEPLIVTMREFGPSAERTTLSTWLYPFEVAFRYAGLIR